jgi:1,4-dihydroxy-2-naphthoyl-CoA hydrolase
MPNLSSRRLGALLGLMPFSEGLGVNLEIADPSNVVGTLAWSADLCTTEGILHGGAIMALADTVGALCAYLNLPDGATTATIESKTNFFRGVSSGLVRAIAKPVHIANRTIVVQTDLLDDQDRSVALVIQTQAVSQRAKPEPGG